MKPSIVIFLGHPFRLLSFALGLLPAMICLLSGCSAPAQHMDPHFGQCVEAAFAAQVINADAPSDRSPADSLPGELADKIYKKRYLKTMTEEKKENDGMSEELGGMN